jgi:hypothetical protein
VAALGIAAAVVIALVIVLSFTLSRRSRRGMAEKTGQSRSTRPRNAPLDVEAGMATNPSRHQPAG